MGSEKGWGRIFRGCWTGFGTWEPGLIFEPPEAGFLMEEVVWDWGWEGEGVFFFFLKRKLNIFDIFRNLNKINLFGALEGRTFICYINLKICISIHI